MSKRIKTVVITGGSCSGKTTTVKWLRQKFGEPAVVYVPEAATLLLKGGFPAPKIDVPMNRKWQESFQKAVAAVQLEMEDMYREVARRRGAQLMICDRGLLDGAAYLPGGINKFCALCQLDLPEIIKRYDLVIHLESLATADPKKYGRSNNHHRFESLKEARYLEFKTRRAWKCHPYRLIYWRYPNSSRDDRLGELENIAKQIESLLQL